MTTLSMLRKYLSVMDKDAWYLNRAEPSSSVKPFCFVLGAFVPNRESKDYDCSICEVCIC